MIQFEKDIEDSEIRIIGNDLAPVSDTKDSQRPRKPRKGCLWLVGAMLSIIIIGVVAYMVSSHKKAALYA